MRRKILFLSLLGFAASVASVARGEPPILQLHKDKGVVAHAGIDALYQRFSKAYSDLDDGAAAGVYSDDAVYLNPGEDLRSGRAAIRDGFAAQFGKAKKDGRHLFLRF